MCIHLVPIKWPRSLVALIPWNLTLLQRHLHWLFSSLSMKSYSKMDEIEMRILILPTCDGFWLKRSWYFEGELPCGTVMSKYCLINDEQYYWEIKIGGGDIYINNKYYQETNSTTKIKYRYKTVYGCIYMYIDVPRQFQKNITQLFSYINKINNHIYI